MPQHSQVISDADVDALGPFLGVSSGFINSVGAEYELLSSLSHLHLHPHSYSASGAGMDFDLWSLSDGYGLHAGSPGIGGGVGGRHWVCITLRGAGEKAASGKCVDTLRTSPLSPAM